MLGALVLGFGGLVLLKAAFATVPDPRQALADIMSGQAFSAPGSGSRSVTVTGMASRQRDTASVPPIPLPLRRTGPFEVN